MGSREHPSLGRFTRTTMFGDVPSRSYNKIEMIRLVEINMSVTASSSILGTWFGEPKEGESLTSGLWVMGWHRLARPNNGPGQDDLGAQPTLHWLLVLTHRSAGRCTPLRHRRRQQHTGRPPGAAVRFASRRVVALLLPRPPAGDLECRKTAYDRCVACCATHVGRPTSRRWLASA